MHLRLATRGSPLALVQARQAASRLRRLLPACQVRMVIISTRGDRDRATALSAFGAVGVFTKEIHEALLDGRADLAVHSAKDLPTQPQAGLAEPAILERTDPRDLLIGVRSLAELPTGARVGSSSPRRREQLLALRPDLRVEDLRGNLHTRLATITAGRFQAILLAAAGLRRLGLLDRYAHLALDPATEMVPAAGQGAIAVDARADRRDLVRLLGRMQDREAGQAVGIERRVLALLQAGCSQPIGVWCRRHDHRWRLIVRHGAAAPGIWDGPAAGLAEQAVHEPG